jgi:hypothetical protein
MKLKDIKPLNKKPLEKHTPTLLQIAKKHGVSSEILMKQLKRGIAVEREHTDDEATATEIALDHLNEFPDYYDRLEKVEHK